MPEGNGKYRIFLRYYNLKTKLQADDPILCHCTLTKYRTELIIPFCCRLDFLSVILFFRPSNVFGIKCNILSIFFNS